MEILWIILGVLGSLLLVALLFLLFGKARIRISVSNGVRVSFLIGSKRFWIYPLTFDQAETEAEARWIKKQLKRRKKRKKTEQAQISAGKPVPNTLEKLQMTVAIVKAVHAQIRGRFTIQVRRFHITVGAPDAAQTAILYGAVVGIASTFMQWIHFQLAPVERSATAMSVIPDYVNGENSADIDIVLKMSLFRALGVATQIIDVYHDEKDRAIVKASRRLAASREREKRNEAAKQAAATE